MSTNRRCINNSCMLDVQQPAGQLLMYMNQNMDVLLLLNYSSTVTLSIRTCLCGNWLRMTCIRVAITYLSVLCVYVFATPFWINIIQGCSLTSYQAVNSLAHICQEPCASMTYIVMNAYKVIYRVVLSCSTLYNNVFFL